jgi:hypothetical protein
MQKELAKKIIHLVLTQKARNLHIFYAPLVKRGLLLQKRQVDFKQENFNNHKKSVILE